jgi:hypothetical protein
MVGTIFAQPDAVTVHEQHGRIVAQLQVSPKPRPYSRRRPRIWSPSPASRRSTGGRSGATTRSSGSTRRPAAASTSSASSPNGDRPLVGLLAEQRDEWALARGYTSAGSIAKTLTDPDGEHEEVMAIEGAA